MPSSAKSSRSPSYFVTGFPGFLARQMVERIVSAAPDAPMALLVQPEFSEQAAAFQRKLGPARWEVLLGDTADMHFGLAGREYQQLCETVSDVFHISSISDPGLPKNVARRLNVEGTRNAIEFCAECSHLRRLNHFSTCHVSGDRTGLVAEDELDCDQGFRNSSEQTQFEAEQLLTRAQEALPVAIFRPSNIVGDSRTGEIDRFEGPFYFGLQWITSPLFGALPLPTDGSAPLNVVPADFVVDAVWALSADPRSAGRTFHLVDPTPLSVRRVYQSISERANRSPPKFSVTSKATDFVLGLPIVEKLARSQRTAISYINQLAFYNCRSALELLDGTGIRCPPLESYIDRLISFFQESQRPGHIPDVDDPLDVSIG